MAEIAFICRHCGAVQYDEVADGCWHCRERYYDPRFWRNARLLLAVGTIAAALFLAYLAFMAVVLALNFVAAH